MTSSIPMRLWRDRRLAERARELAERHLGTELPQRWAHTRAVAALTARVAAVVAPDAEHILVAAAFLHDIGYNSKLRITGFHPLDGAEFAREETFPEIVVALVAYHCGAQEEATQRGLDGPLSQFLVPPRGFLDVITYADLHISPTGADTNPADRLTDVLKRYDRHHVVHRAIRRSGPELLAAAARVHKQVGGHRGLNAIHRSAGHGTVSIATGGAGGDVVALWCRAGKPLLR